MADGGIACFDVADAEADATFATPVSGGFVA